MFQLHDRRLPNAKYGRIDDCDFLEVCIDIFTNYRPFCFLNAISTSLNIRQREKKKLWILSSHISMCIQILHPKIEKKRVLNDTLVLILHKSFADSISENQKQNWNWLINFSPLSLSDVPFALLLIIIGNCRKLFFFFSLLFFFMWRDTLWRWERNIKIEYFHSFTDDDLNIFKCLVISLKHTHTQLTPPLSFVVTFNDPQLKCLSRATYKKYY